MSDKEKKEEIRQVQHALRVLNKNGEPVPEIFEDGFFGAETEQAVNAFQKMEGLEERGEINAETWERLMKKASRIERENEPPLPILPFHDDPSSVVLVHQSGEAVWFAQVMFRIIARSFSGFDKILVDGINDGATTAAIQKVQEISGCACRDGTLDKTTWNEVAKLFSFCG